MTVFDKNLSGAGPGHIHQALGRPLYPGAHLGEKLLIAGHVQAGQPPQLAIHAAQVQIQRLLGFRRERPHGRGNGRGPG